ncbi:MAG: DUF2958 domain-containing protein [Hyphomicrobiales bacterium]|nr:DUF2958 domain-containing protein [Hyphomicrobiales bacterium]
MEQSWPNRSSPQAQPSQLLSKGPAHNAAGEDIDPPPVVKSFTPDARQLLWRQRHRLVLGNDDRIAWTLGLRDRTAPHLARHSVEDIELVAVRDAHGFRGDRLFPVGDVLARLRGAAHDFRQHAADGRRVYRVLDHDGFGFRCGIDLEKQHLARGMERHAHAGIFGERCFAHLAQSQAGALRLRHQGQILGHPNGRRRIGADHVREYPVKRGPERGILAAADPVDDSARCLPRGLDVFQAKRNAVPVGDCDQFKIFHDRGDDAGCRNLGGGAVHLRAASHVPNAIALRGLFQIGHGRLADPMHVFGGFLRPFLAGFLIVA